MFMLQVQSFGLRVAEEQKTLSAVDERECLFPATWTLNSELSNPFQKGGHFCLYTLGGGGALSAFSFRIYSLGEHFGFKT